MGLEMVECEDEALYGREYLQWKKQTLGNQVSDHKFNCDFSKKHEDDSDDEDNDEEEAAYDEAEHEYRLDMYSGYRKGKGPGAKCLGLIVEGGYMFLLDRDMAHFPLVTWRCPRYRADGCAASFVTRITNPEAVQAGLASPSPLAVATSLAASHVMDNLDKIEDHAKHRPRHYKEDISPLIYGLFSRECREAFAKYLRNLLTPCFPLPPERPPPPTTPDPSDPSIALIIQPGQPSTSQALHM